MKRKQWCLAAALVLVLAVSFCVRALPAFLPSVSEELRPVLQDEDGDPYLTEMDSYFYARFAREMAEAGAPFQYNRRSEDPLMGQRYTVDSGQGIPVLLSVLASRSDQSRPLRSRSAHAKSMLALSPVSAFTPVSMYCDPVASM